MRNDSKIIYSFSTKGVKKPYKKKNLLPLIIALILLGLAILTITKILFKKNEPKELSTEATQEVVSISEDEINIDSNDFKNMYQIFETIDGQTAYIAIKETFSGKDSLPIIIYSHGSTYTITEDKSNPLLKDLEMYAKEAVKNGYIFAASNQHGDNWGNNQSIEDTRKLIEYINYNFPSSGDIYLIGFSMGGLPTMNFAAKYPERIKKIALLAPTSYATAWNQARVDIITEIPIQIWHGNKDVNVPYSMSTSLIKRLSSYGKNVDLITVDGKGHFDIDTELITDIFDYFKTE